MPISGECIQQLVFRIAEDPAVVTTTLDIPKSTTRDCCNDFILNALADTESSDPFKNDYWRIVQWFPDVVDTATIKMYKHNGSAFVLSATLTGTSDYGTDFPLSHFINNKGEIFVGYLVEWKKVITLKGPGNYLFKIEYTTSLGDSYTIESEAIFCLKQYQPHLADGTVKLEYSLFGELGDIYNDQKKKDFGTMVVTNMFRLPGYFGFPNYTYEEERVKYNNGQLKYVTDSQNPEYLLKLEPIPAFVHNVLRTDVMQSDNILITDYARNNAEKWIQKRVYKVSGYEPVWKPLQSKLAPIEIKFRPEFNRNQKYRN